MSTNGRRPRSFPAHELFKKLGNLGLLGLTKPEAYGGAGLDYSYAVAMAETLGHIDCGGIPMAIGVQTDMCTPALARFGSDELRREFLAPAIAGDMVGCIGVSEPGAGSDVASIKSYARKDGDDYVITGQKMWITNSLQADWMCMLVNTSDGPQHKNKSLVMVPMDSKGIEKAKKIRKIGMHSSDTGLIHFDEVRVPQRNRIGAEGQGFMYQMMQFQEERLWAAASAIQGLTNCIEDHRLGAGAQAVRRHAGRPAMGAVQAGRDEDRCRGAARADLPRLRAVCAGAGRDRAGLDVQAAGRPAEPLGADGCLQFWGGMGFTWENRVSRMYRDGRLGSIGGGADEVMLGILAKTMGIAKRPPRA
jgi:citronellyl-CoA dehydrogenase